jgi:Permuted papain-like amidase enzyme, YaeF/YiiX, C92 family
VANIRLMPQPARNFGYIPDLSRCKAGDLILSCSRQPDYIDALIERTQRHLGFATEHCRWTHAAVFLYDDFVLEAVPWKGVITRSLYEDIPDSILTVRRNSGLTDDQRYRIAMCAQKMLGTRYSWVAAIDAGLKARFQPWRRDWYRTEKTVVCSQVYSDAYTQITLQFFSGCESGNMISPAHLHATSSLETIDVPWLKVPG